MSRLLARLSHKYPARTSQVRRECAHVPNLDAVHLLDPRTVALLLSGAGAVGGERAPVAGGDGATAAAALAAPPPDPAAAVPEPGAADERRLLADQDGGAVAAPRRRLGAHRVLRLARRRDQLGRLAPRDPLPR
eukprot:5621532-Pleurochrysis_carterae.AAC.2